MQNYIKRTQVATAITKRLQKAEEKTETKFADSFQKPRFPKTVPSAVNIMPIVNVNVNLNLTQNPTKGAKAVKDETITSKFNWGKELASVAAAAGGLSQDQLASSMLGLKRLATHSPFLNREKIVHQMQHGMEIVLKQ